MLSTGSFGTETNPPLFPARQSIATNSHGLAPAVALALLVELASEAVVRGPADDALLVQGGDDAIRLLLDEGDAVAVVGEVDEGPLQLLAAVLLLKATMRPIKSVRNQIILFFSSPRAYKEGR